MSLYHHFVQIQAYKHDGSFHRLWSHGFVVRDDEDYYVIVSNRSRVIESNNHKWYTRDKAALIFSKKEWFNVIATFYDDGIHYYVNIASPSIYDKGYIKFIDYDLDLKGFPSGFTKVLDVNEFNAHCKLYNYSDDLKQVLDMSLKKAIDRFNKKEEPFVDAKINEYIKNFDDYIANQVLQEKQK